MTFPSEEEVVDVEGIDGWWNAEIDVTRTPSPGIPAKRMKMTLEDIAQDFHEIGAGKDSEYNNLLRVEKGPEELGYGTSAQSFSEMWFTGNDSSQPTVRKVPVHEPMLRELTAMEFKSRKKKMQTGCIPCLYVQLNDHHR